MDDSTTLAEVKAELAEIHAKIDKLLGGSNGGTVTTQDSGGNSPPPPPPKPGHGG